MDRIVYIFYRLICTAVALLPLGLGFRLGSVLGWLAYWVLRPYRRLAIDNLSMAFAGEKSPRAIRRLARRHFARLGANLISSVKFVTMPPKEILKRVKVENLEILHAALAEGRGVVWVVSHMGNWELLASMAPQVFPCKNGTVYQRLSNPYIDADVRSARERLGVLTFERKEGFLGAIALVRGGGTTAVLVDQHAGDAGIWCPFFGRLASTSPLAATLALRTGAVLIPLTPYTDKPGRWRLVLGEPLPIKTRDAAALTAEINLALEQVVRHAPEDWFWVHNRWKTPRPNFLLAEYKRGVVLPEGVVAAQLKPFQIVVRSGNWLGDAVMSTPAVQAIKRGRPDVRLTVLTRAKLAEYWKRVPEVDEAIAISDSDSVFSVAGKLRGKFDVAIVFPNSPRSALEVWLAGVPRRVGYPAKWRRLLLNQTVPAARPLDLCRPARHQVNHYLDLARFLGANLGTPEEQTESGAFLKSALPKRTLHPGGKLKLGLCPGAEYGPAKRWMPERFAETARAVALECDCEWVLFGTEADAATGAKIARQLEGRCVNLIGRTTLSELMDRLSECQLLLTNDTGTMHLAAFLGVPTVAIFGSTEPRLTAPLGQGHQILRHQVECSPCFLRDCPLDFRCMKAVTVEETAAAVLRGIGCSE